GEAASVPDGAARRRSPSPETAGTAAPPGPSAAASTSSAPSRIKSVPPLVPATAPPGSRSAAPATPAEPAGPPPPETDRPAPEVRALERGGQPLEGIVQRDEDITRQICLLLIDKSLIGRDELVKRLKAAGL